MLKILPSYTKRPRICELVRTEITNISVKGAWRGPARLQLFEHVLAPLADLPVREIISATHILTDLTLSPATVIYDYLTDSAPSTSSKRPANVMPTAQRNILNRTSKGAVSVADEVSA